jgi:TPR repeat protein
MYLDRHLCRRALVVLGALGLFASLAWSRPEDKSRKVALLVGVNVYDNRKFDDLQYAERDVTELAKELRTAGYDVRLLTGSGAGADRATKANVEKALADVLKKVTKKDTLLVALAGHGQQVPVKGDDGREKMEAFFCPRDAMPDKSQTMVSMSFMLQQLDERGGGTNLVLVDACRNDPSPGRGRGIDGNRVEALPEGTAVLFSCSRGQRAFESAKAGGGHGVFFHFVLEAMRGKAKNDKGAVTWDRLVTYVKEQVEDQFPKLVPDMPTRQQPHEVRNLGRTSVLLEAISSLLADLQEYDRLRFQSVGDAALTEWATGRAGSWKEAAERGSAAGQVLLGHALRLGAGVAKNEKESIQWYRKAADQGYVWAQHSLGWMYASGTGVAQDYPEALRWFRKAVDQGFAPAQYDTGVMYQFGEGVAKNEAEAAQWYRKAADQGDANGQFSLGVLNFNGQGLAKNEAEAARLYKKAADQGHAWARTNLGIMHYNGQGLAKDEAEAAKWFRVAADQGNATAQYYMGVMSYNGQGMAKDEAQAAKWYKKAADQGNVGAQYYLGVMSETGRGVAQDEAEAVKWYRKAADQGYAQAQYDLGVMYENGEGVAKDKEEALKWYRKAADQKYEAAIKAVRRLSGSM